MKHKHLNVKILGCSGGVGGAEIQTTSLLIGEHTLIDAGTGVAALTLEQLAKINRIFFTHSHMDHIAIAPMIVDSTSDMRNEPLALMALEETITSIRKHIYNWEIWPDFSEIKINDYPLQSYHTLKVGQTFDLPMGQIIVGPADHQVPACSYLVVGAEHKLFFSGDTTISPAIVEFLHANAPIEHIIFECAFGRRERKLAQMSKHLNSDLVCDFIETVNLPANYYITHLKPNQRDVIMDEILERNIPRSINRLFTFQNFRL